jgi:hypothetical protein
MNLRKVVFRERLDAINDSYDNINQVVESSKNNF